MSDFGGVLGNESIGEQMQQEPRHHVDDAERAAQPGEPPVEQIFPNTKPTVALET